MYPQSRAEAVDARIEAGGTSRLRGGPIWVVHSLSPAALHPFGSGCLANIGRELCYLIVRKIYDIF